ncbi:MAG TPA: CdaR family protein [Anaerolineae bacterium]|nr:CdaR family protein [Anaerolineae bacterium]
MPTLRSLLSQLALFILSVILATAIWITAQSTDNPVNTLNGEIRVQPIGQRADVNISISPESIAVIIEGPQNLLLNLNPDEIFAQVDLSQAPLGTSRLPVTVPFDREGLNITDYYPREVTVTIEEIVTRDIPIRVDILGSTARGYDREAPIIEPTTVAVTGPASRVSNLAEAVVTLHLDNARETTARQLSLLIFRDNAGASVSVNNLNLSTRSVNVTVPINQLAGFAEKPVTAQWVGEPAEGYRVTNVTVEPNSLLVTGPAAQLDALDRLLTEQIDIEGITSSFTQPVTIELPTNIALEEIQPILVQVEIEPILTTDAILKNIDILDLAPGYTATIQPADVRVFVIGPLPILNGLQESDIRVTVDLFGLEAGIHRLAPTIDISKPDISIRSAQPEFVNINITRIITEPDTITTTIPIEDSALPTLPLTQRSPSPNLNFSSSFFTLIKPENHWL